MALSVQGVGPDHITQICAMHLQNLIKRTSASADGSKSHSSGKCTSRPNVNREEPRSTPRDLQDHRMGNSGSKTCNFNMDNDSCYQTRFDKKYNRQYSPNYNNFQQSPLGSIPGQDLSATLIELANIQSRSLEMMATCQRSQQEAFHQLIKASKDKANDAMFANIKNYNGKNRQVFKDWIDEIDQACQVSDHDFRHEIIKKLSGVVQKVVMSCENYSDDTTGKTKKLRSCFSDVPTMDEAREELRNMRQMENESITVYTYKSG